MPGLVQFLNCDSVILSGINLMDSGGDVVRVGQSSCVDIDGITIKNGGLPGIGMTLTENKHLSLSNCYLKRVERK